MLLTPIKYLFFAMLFTPGENKFADTVLQMYEQISHRFDDIWQRISGMDSRINALEKRVGENNSETCNPCVSQGADNETSNKEDDLRGEINITMRAAFDAEKANLRETVQLMEQTMEKTMNVCNETGTELKQKMSQLENEKADNGRVSMVEKTLNLIQSSADDLRNRTELVESKITEQQNCSRFGSRLDDIESNVSTVMETMKKKVSFSAQFRIINTSGMDISKNTTIRFNHVFHNDGGGYNVSTGKFTVPISGVYMFIFFVESFQKVERNICPGGFVKLYVDDVYAEMSAIADPNYQQHIQAGNSYIKNFTEGQRVFIRTTDTCPTSYIGGTRTTFSGLLLY
ncbi:uncharacterized protein LOC132723168 isoform X3 [Ruditapes philippinarum]|uniref:uncharacterized protein LOC132723168 isoform X3 n=1 Tax=Ruditapes philippinarum TaxID=129788 RepID=UPI00295BEAF3|nr:uncharacterized protein LOC132723168 isoform X3 [Ruditapes philippinarum]